MFNTKTIVAGILGGIVYFLLGWAFYGMLLADFFDANAGTATNVMRADDEMIFWSLFLAVMFDVSLLSSILFIQVLHCVLINPLFFNIIYIRSADPIKLEQLLYPTQ